MYTSMRLIMAANHGLITTHQARDCGLTTSQIAHLVRSGAIVPVRHGVYADGELWASLDKDRAQPRLRTRAAILTMRRTFVVSHDSSAHEHGLELLMPPNPHVHITRPGSTAAWARAGVKHHLARYTSAQVMTVNGLDVMDLARTAVDIAREHGAPYGEIACDAAMRLGVPRHALEQACAVMTSWPYILRIRQAVAFADRRAANLAETLGRLFVVELGLVPDDLQFPVRIASGKVRWGDILVGCHLFEIDGNLKLRPPSEGGVAEKPAVEVVWDEKKRDRDLAREGLGASHIIWQDYWPPHRAEALKRVRAEYDESVSRFGDRTPERLLRQAREIRGQWGA
jgi:hypothetical protein